MNDQRRVLLLTTEPLDDGSLREAVRRHVGEGVARVRVVAPLSKLSPLEWVTNDEDERRAEAAQIGEQAAEAVSDVAPADVEVGDADPVPVDLPLDDAARDRLAALVQRVCGTAN